MGFCSIAALTLAVGGAIRHNHTPYDELLTGGVERAAARLQIADNVDEILRDGAIKILLLERSPIKNDA